MKYSKSDCAYFRNSKKENSIKGGKLKENGILDSTDFHGKNGNNVVPKQKFKTEQNNNMGFELQHMNPNPNHIGKYMKLNNLDKSKINNATNSVKPIKIMIQKLTGEPYIFFGYNPETDIYHNVVYNNSRLNPDYITNPIKYKKLNRSGNIVELSHQDFLNIGIEELIVLCYHFLIIRKKNHGFMERLYKYLKDFVFEKVLGTQFPNSNNHRMYRDMVKEITQMVLYKGHRILNQHGGKLDVYGKLDRDDFIINYNNGFELQELQENNIRPPPRININQRNQSVPPKEIIQKRFPYEPYIFFGYDTEIKKYRCVCYNQVVGDPVFRRLEDDGTISQKLTLDLIKKIGNPILLELFCFLNNKTTNRSDGTQYMERLQRYLIQEVGVKIPIQDYC